MASYGVLVIVERKMDVFSVTFLTFSKRLGFIVIYNNPEVEQLIHIWSASHWDLFLEFKAKIEVGLTLPGPCLIHDLLPGL